MWYDSISLFHLVYGVVGGDARAAEKWFACLLSKKWHRDYLEMVVFVCLWMSLAVVSSGTLLLKVQRAKRTQRKTGERQTVNNAEIW